MKPGDKVADCHECLMPVFYGTPFCWVVCDCSTEHYVHQSCMEAAAKKIQEEENEERPAPRALVN